MKKIVLTIILILFYGFVLGAPGRGSLDVSDIRFDKQGDRVTLGFRIAAGKKVVRKGGHLVVTPVLAKEGRRMVLPLIVVEGRTARTLRKLDAAQPVALDAGTVYLKNSGETDYRATLPFAEWMQGADLLFEGTDIVCCSERDMDLGLIAADVMNPGTGSLDFVVTETVHYEKPAPKAPTAGDRFAGLYSFIAPLEDFAPSIDGYDAAKGGAGTGTGAKGAVTPEALPGILADSEVSRQEAERYIANNQEGALVVYFKQGIYEMDASYRDNAAMLELLYKVVREIHDSGNSEVAHVIIAGFASPEGTVQFNDRLAWSRAAVVKELLVENTPLEDNMVSAYNGSVNWYKLRELVSASDMKRKEQVLSIIDSAPVESTRLDDTRIPRLKALDGGAPYRYMLDNLFPMLRNAAYIKVYYENTDR